MNKNQIKVHSLKISATFFVDPKKENLLYFTCLSKGEKKIYIYLLIKR